jgi:hypothetical protein
MLTLGMTALLITYHIDPSVRTPIIPHLSYWPFSVYAQSRCHYGLPAHIHITMGQQWTQAKLELERTLAMQLDISPTWSQKWTRPAVSGQRWRWRPLRGGNWLQLSQTYKVIYPYISCPEIDPKSDSGRYSLLIHPDLFISIHTYLLVFMTYSFVFCT